MGDGTIRVLLVGRDAEDLGSVGSYLEEADPGVTVETATTLGTTLDRLDESGIDCVLCCGGLPGATPVELIETVRERFTAVPIVMYPAEGDEALASEALGAGGADYLRRGDVAEQAGELAERVGEAVSGNGSSVDAPAADERLLELVEAARDLLWLATGDMSELLYVNRVYEERWGYDREEVYEDFEAYIEHMPEEDRAEEREFIDRMAEWAESGDAPDQITDAYPMYTADGELRWVREIIVPLRDEDGAVRWWGGIERDITDRKRREEELRRQNERLEQFTGVVSHDLRNPLNVAAGHVEQARKSHDSDDLEVAATALSRMESLIDRLLALARQGHQVEDVSDVALSTVVRATWEVVDTGGADLTVESDAVVCADPDRLQQLLENLFRNAVEHGGRDVSVRVGMTDDGPGLFVADDGPGIPAEERADVLASGYSSTADGTGFGLPIVAEIAEAHGWTLDIAESEAGGAKILLTGVELAEGTTRAGGAFGGE